MKANDFLEGQFLVTLCRDGYLSFMEKGKKGQRRLGSALPVVGVRDVFEAMNLIIEMSFLRPVQHSPKTGLLIEPFYKNWPLEGGDLEHFDAARKAFLEKRDELRRKSEKERKAG